MSTKKPLGDARQNRTLRSGFVKTFKGLLEEEDLDIGVCGSADATELLVLISPPEEYDDGL